VVIAILFVLGFGLALLAAWPLLFWVLPFFWSVIT
jgi:hypothetical protein